MNLEDFKYKGKQIQIKKETPTVEEEEETKKKPRTRNRKRIGKRNRVEIKYEEEKEEEEDDEGEGGGEEMKTVPTSSKSSFHSPIAVSQRLSQLEKITVFRKTIVAPVDQCGAEALPQEDADPKTKRFHTLVGLMLSSQTKDQITAAAVKNLQEKLPAAKSSSDNNDNKKKQKEEETGKAGLTIKNVLGADQDLIADLIYPVGFYRRKAEYLKKTAKILHDQFGGDIPNTIEKLVSLPGVGPKMAHIAMNVAWNKFAEKTKQKTKKK